jgi:mxaJ protein
VREVVDFAREENPPLVVTPIDSIVEARVPMTFDISMGVQRTGKELKGEVESPLSSLAPQINAILASYGVPVVWEMQTDP